jgi:hypothetical protein
MSWRTSGDPPAGKHKLSEPKTKTKAPCDPTYGSEPDMLDHPGLIVEPDVRRKIAKYFKAMKLREMIESVLDEMGYVK